MKKYGSITSKFYNNLDFINSPDGRIFRILAEYLGPLSLFRRKKISDTIVFFGSARAESLKIAKQNLSNVKSSLNKQSRNLSKREDELKNAQKRLQLAGYYEQAKELAFHLTTWSLSVSKKNKRFVICSGGGPGIMEAANLGAKQAGGQSIGLNISLPFEMSSNPFISKSLNIEFHYFFMRKLWFLYLAKAMIIFPGGFGTLDELMEVLTLIQCKKINKKMTIVLYGTHYWKEIINFDALSRWGTISPEDLKIFKFADSPQRAFSIIKKGLEKFYLEPEISTLDKDPPLPLKPIL